MLLLLLLLLFDIEAGETKVTKRNVESSAKRVIVPMADPLSFECDLHIGEC